MNENGAADRLLVLIPAYNEEGAIGHVVFGVRQVLADADILVIDDASTDNTYTTAQAAGALVVRHPFNLGIGGTFQTGLKFALQGNYARVVRLDGDGQHDPVDIPAMLAVLTGDEADIVVCSRFLGTELMMDIPLARRIGIFLFAATVSALTGRRATDTTSGFQALNRKAITTLATFMPQDYPEVEGRVITHKAGLRTLELPTQMRMRATGVSSINRWRSFYYACKVSIAACICALKDIPLARISDQ
jgi:glycosyltransferase involved in cell wall biosynthesis